MPKSDPYLVTFERKDEHPEYIVDVCKEIADHFKPRRGYVPQFCRLISGSKRWTMENLQEKLQLWINVTIRIPETRKFVELISKAFNLCQNNDDISSLRGGMVESLVIAAYGGAQVLGKDGYGWGALVKIKKKNSYYPVIYNCHEHKGEDCSTRVTVDFGHWNGFHGRFYECKVNPIKIGCKEIMYMTELDKRLADISHEIFFVCAESYDAVKVRLDSYNQGIKFKPVGYDTLFNKN